MYFLNALILALAWSLAPSLLIAEPVHDFLKAVGGPSGYRYETGDVDLCPRGSTPVSGKIPRYIWLVNGPNTEDFKMGLHAQIKASGSYCDDNNNTWHHNPVADFISLFDLEGDACHPEISHVGYAYIGANGVSRDSHLVDWRLNSRALNRVHPTLDDERLWREVIRELPRYTGYDYWTVEPFVKQFVGFERLTSKDSVKAEFSAEFATTCINENNVRTDVKKRVAYRRTL